VSSAQLDNIYGIGDGIKKKVDEFITQGRMTHLEHLKQDLKVRVSEELTKIWGVGPSVAEKLYF
jgi:DNA polymerase/3'-5' exonuclease PolX